MKFLITKAVIVFSVLLLAVSAFAGPTKKSSVTVAGNTAGLTLILDCTRQGHISGVVVAGAAATVNFDVSEDRQSWDTHTVLLSAASGTALIDVTTGFPHVRITSATTGVALTYKLGCKE